ncbi:MAG TPA: NADH-quinone oxidoreductase subunit L [Gemmatimonadales bacterium]|nr:NADH-quinone oxidoreductase subunit L [Gemmatimonadales bacterium]
MVALLWLVVLLPLAGAIINGALALWRPTAKGVVTAVAVGALAGSFAAAVGLFITIAQAPSPVFRLVLWHWLPVTTSFSIDFAFQADHLSLVMLLIITGIGGLIHLFSVGYMHSDPGYARYFAYLNLFVVFMLVLVLGSSLPVSFIGWEGVGLCSYLLIGFWFEVDANSNAGKKAFLANRVGDFGVMVAMFLIWWHLGTLEFSGIAQQAPALLGYGSSAATLITLLIFLGCTGKSAQIPLYVWLPDAMAGPTPVSALIHAATMVTAGIFLVVRTGVLFALAPTTLEVIALIGALTAFFAASIGLRQFDIKKVLAYSTVSQLGYMFLGVGTGEYATGIFHLITHAFFKALLFLGAGSVIHAMHHALHKGRSHADAQDMRNMGGLARAMPWTFALMGLATLAIAGVPPFSGFFSKDAILGAAFARGVDHPVYLVCWALGLAAALMTAFYMARLMTMTFLGDFRGSAEARAHLHEAPWIMTAPLLVLGALSVVGGVVNLPAFVGGGNWLDHWLAPVTAPAAAIFHVAAEPAASMTWVLIGVAVVVAIGGLLAGWQMTVRANVVSPERTPPEHGLANVISHKYYVDELYSRTIVQPTIWLSRRVLWQTVDQLLIDRIGVGGTARVAAGLGWLGSRLQNGQVAFYVAMFAAGAAIILRTLVR